MMVDPTTGEIRDAPGRASVTRIPSSGGTILDSLSEALEDVTDRLMEALEIEGNLAAEREEAHGDAMDDLKEEGVAPSARKEIANSRVAKLTAQHTRADRRVKKWRVKWDTIQARLVVEQSRLKFFGAQDGGQR